MAEEKLSFKQRLLTNLRHLGLSILVIGIISIAINLAYPKNINIEQTPSGIGEYSLATVKSIKDDKEVENPYISPNESTKNFEQVLELKPEFTKNPDTQLLTTQNSYNSRNQDQNKYKVGDFVIVNQFKEGESEPQYFIVSRFRLFQVLLIFGLFVVLLIALAGIKGIGSLLGMGFSLYVLIAFTIPYIIAGYNTLTVGIISIFVIALSSLYIAHGFNRRTSIALGSTLLTSLLAILFSFVAVKFSTLSGVADEESAYLLTIPSLGNLDLQGLLLCGIIISTLGILDDITTAQVAVVEELIKTDPNLKPRQVFTKAMNVGREHITSLVNTLVLAYAGTSLPLLITIYIYRFEPVWVWISRESIIQEIIRTISGSMALLIAVPISTLLASLYFTYLHSKKLEKSDPLIGQIRKKDDFNFKNI